MYLLCVSQIAEAPDFIERQNVDPNLVLSMMSERIFGKMIFSTNDVEKKFLASVRKLSPDHVYVAFVSNMLRHIIMVTRQDIPHSISLIQA